MPRVSLPSLIPQPSAWQEEQTAPETLVERLSALRRLREHHLWEILRSLPSLAAAREDAAFRHAFRFLMECDDLEGAGRALIAAARPRRRLDRLQTVDGAWVARVLSSEAARDRAVAVHADRLAAVMIALVALDRDDTLTH